MRSWPTTFEMVEAIALRQPQRLALVQDTTRWSYEALYHDLIRVIRVLHGLGVGRGHRVAVGTTGFQAGMLLLIASENLGAVTTSFLASGDPDTDVLFGLVDWVFSDEPQACPPGVKFQRVESAFLAAVQRVDPDDATAYPRVSLDANEPQRISRTSGSSGRSKFMVLSRWTQEFWVRAGAENGGYRPESRLLVAGPLVQNAVFTRSCACLRMGAAVLDLSRTGLPGHEVTHVLALPVLLEDILKSLPARYAPGGRVDVGTVGGFVSADLRQRAMSVFGGSVASRYGANEVCGICDDLDAAGTGVVSAGVDIRIVDEDGQSLPDGQVGIVVVRTPGMVDGYIGDPEASRAAFRDGWFHSGDWGAMVGHRRLRLAGRHDDLVNVGGIKLPAAELESRVRQLTQASDCAVLAVNLESGAITVGIALVVDPAAPRQLLLERLTEGLQLGPRVGAKVTFLDGLPRMANGKLDRVALHGQFQVAMSRA